MRDSNRNHGEIISRFESPLYVLAFTAMKFSTILYTSRSPLYNFSPRTTRTRKSFSLGAATTYNHEPANPSYLVPQQLTTTTTYNHEPANPSHLVPQHLTTTNPQALLRPQSLQLEYTKEGSSSWSPNRKGSKIPITKMKSWLLWDWCDWEALKIWSGEISLRRN